MVIKLMNDNEQKAFNWLILQGIKKEEITFRRNKSPDFILKNGKNIEVKTIHHNHITFFKGQFDKLRDTDNVNIMIFKNGRLIMNFPFSEIDNQKIKYWIDSHYENKKHLQIVLDDDTSEKLENIIRISGKSKQNYFEDLIKEVIDCQTKKKN